MTTIHIQRPVFSRLCFAAETLFPAGCPVCGRPLVYEHEAYFGICEDCAAAFPVDSASSRCTVCGRTLISEQQLCTRCRAEKPRSFDRAVTVYPYTGKWLSLLHAYKFQGKRALARFFAAKIDEARSCFFNADTGDLVYVPVPPRPGKMKAAGWDQVESIARILTLTGGKTPVLRCLKRLKSESQKKLDARGRAQNLKGRILCTQKPPRSVLLIDDVFTTGATLDACAQALKAAGAEQVYGLCLFQV